MFKSLFWKEWRQLRMLRAIAAILFALLPPMLLMLAEMSYRGWLPFGRVSSMDVDSLMMDAVPACLVAGWFIFTLLIVAQSQLADRASGTEAFLLEKPVGRGKVWRVRMTAALASILLVAAVGIVLWLLYSWMIADPRPGQWDDAFQVIGGAGSAAILIGFFGGMAASAFLNVPMGAFLLGAVLAVFPLGLAFVLSSWFPFAAFQRIPLGAVLPMLLFPVLLICSWTALCRGEPMGRGRYARAGMWLGGGIVVVLLSFVIGTPVVMRASIKHDLVHAAIYPSPSSDHAVLLAGNYWGAGGWLIESGTGEKLDFLPPVVETAVWSPWDDRLAVPSFSGPLGSYGDRCRIDLYDPSSGRIEQTIELPAGHFLRDLRWIPGTLVIDSYLMEGTTSKPRKMKAVGIKLITYSLDSGEQHLMEIDVPFPHYGYHDYKLVGPSEDGKLYLATLIDGPYSKYLEVAGEDPKERPVPEYTLHALSFSENRIDTNSLFTQQGTPAQTDWLLSPSGRYWIVIEYPEGLPRHAPITIRDLVTGVEEHLMDEECFAVYSVWLEGDRLAWVDRREDKVQVRCWAPDRGVLTLGEWPGSADSGYAVDASPDRSHLLLRVFEEEERAIGSCIGDDVTPGFKAKTATFNLVYNVKTEAWTDLSADGPRSYPNWWRSTRWAGPRTLCWSDGESLALESLDNPGELTYLID